MTIKKFIKTIFFWEILQGMMLTLSNLPPKNAVTRQYPEEPFTSLPGFRGLHALVRNPETGREKCIACGLCAAVCPSRCITIHTGEDDKGEKIAEEYEVEVLRCLFCGFCVEACPVGAVVLTPHYAYSDYSRDAFKYNKEMLLDNWDKFLPGAEGKWYLDNIWMHPNRDDYRAHDDQAVFRGASSAISDEPAMTDKPAKEDK
jgi:NADH-quinone oxidoreductase subunit I